MFGGRSSEQWIAQYASSHTHPVNRFCHSLGIPLIVVSLALAVAAIFYHPLWMLAAGLFIFGWLLQFIGHAFEHKPAGILSGLALSAGGRALVVGQDARQSLRDPSFRTPCATYIISLTAILSAQILSSVHTAGALPP